MSYLDWKAGDKLVCVSTWKSSIECDPGCVEVGPVEGQIYTIRSMVSALEKDGEQIGVRLVEFINPQNPRRRPDHGGSQEVGFRAARFRPVQKRNADISVFTALLNPSDKDKHLIEVFDFVSMQGDLQ